MNLKDLERKLRESKEPKGSFDDAACQKQRLIESIKSERFDDLVVTQSIRLSNNKVTDNLIEQYRHAASSKELTADMVILSIMENSQFKIGNKYMFVDGDEIIAIRKEMIPESIGTIDEIKSSIRRKIYG